MLLALVRVLEELLLDLRVTDSAVGPYVDVVLRCLVTLFLAEEGLLAVRVRTSIQAEILEVVDFNTDRLSPDYVLTEVALG